MELIRHYIENMIFYMLVAVPFYGVGRVFYLKKKKANLDFKRELILTIFTLYSIGLASQTIIPRWSAGILTETGKFYFDVYIVNEMAGRNWVPFDTINNYFSPTNESVNDWNSISILNLAGNVFLFSPIGYFLPYLWRRWRSFIKILCVGIIVPCFIEFVQLFIGRSSDIDDIILNAFGVLIGYGVYKLLNLITNNLSSKQEPFLN
ncbi:VanZ family protein [Sporosarcina sp. CAU 1771]